MPVRFSYCPFRLLFKHPFGTAHGVRTGTDSVFVRVEYEGVTGYGEATLPPYVEETVPEVIERLKVFASGRFQDIPAALRRLTEDPTHDTAPGFRNAVNMALIDALSKQRQLTVDQLIDCSGSKLSVVLMTLGITPEAEIASKLAELPKTGALKVKVNGDASANYVKHVLSLTDRPLFVDANQGLLDVTQALELEECIGRDRLLGFEQPFGKERRSEHAELTKRSGVPVYGDESIQDLADLERAGDAFGGVNIKLMKCGGLDRAVSMAKRAGELGMRVMLGSMSESSLGCTAMAQLSGMADIADLDGPWLVANDPFEGIGLKGGQLVVPAGPGVGARLVADLRFNSICA